MLYRYALTIIKQWINSMLFVRNFNSFVYLTSCDCYMHSFLKFCLFSFDIGSQAPFLKVKIIAFFYFSSFLISGLYYIFRSVCNWHKARADYKYWQAWKCSVTALKRLSSDFNVLMYRYTKNILIQFYVALHKIITHKDTLCMQVLEKN